jgi:hypothetical protein
VLKSSDHSSAVPSDRSDDSELPDDDEALDAEEEANDYDAQLDNSDSDCYLDDDERAAPSHVIPIMSAVISSSLAPES